MRPFSLLALCFLLLLNALNAQVPPTRFQLSNGKETGTYKEVIQWWERTAKASPRLQLKKMGMTDAGEPLHLAIFSPDKDFDFASAEKKNRVKILVNNGIHPGEPDGIDASMLLAQKLISGKIQLPSNVVIAFIPVYNIGGLLNRSPWYRVDQNGPDSFGFRGNAQNLDLNRDFIKSDSKNATAFAEIFHLVDPDIFIDNHVSNGADYQHVMTLISTQHNKLGGAMGDFLQQQMEPGIYAMMREKGFDLVPYVNFFGETPEKGWAEFHDGPRYSTGYAALFQCFSFMPETHMLKPYPQRVEATEALMDCFIAYASGHASAIKSLKKQARAQLLETTQLPVSWKLNRTQQTQITFKGYASGYKPSGISGLPRLFYDRARPFTLQVPFYNYYETDKAVTVPNAYILPQGWWAVAELLKKNGVPMRPILNDTLVEVEMYRIADYQSPNRPFEKHYLHSKVSVTKTVVTKRFRKGDWLIPTQNAKRRFIVEVLEPEAPDSYFAWNFFDAILGQKEGYSSYVFEDTAEEWLRNNPAAKAQLDEKRRSDTAFAKNGAAQLEFVYKLSPYYEPDHLQYPVYRVLK